MKSLPRPRKKPSIFKWTVGIAMLAFFLGALWLAFNSTAMDRFLRRFSDQQHVMQEATTARGSEEIRKAGCSRATVMSPELRKQMRAPSRGRTRNNEAPSNETLVTCVTKPFADPPSCDALARVYVDAAHPSGSFRINVRKPTRSSECSSDYDSSGTPIALDGGI